MNKISSLIAVLACTIGISFAFAQEAPKPIEKANGPKVFIKGNSPFSIKHFHKKSPFKAMEAIEFFKFADELDLTDEQIIQLRGYYKKYYKNQPSKPETPKTPAHLNFLDMTEEEINRFADEKTKEIKEKFIAGLQKFIDFKKILTPEQIKKLKSICEEKANKAKNKKENLNKKNWHKHGFGGHHMMPMPPMQPMFPPQCMMHPNMTNMCPSMHFMQPMPPMQPMCPPQGMMQPNKHNRFPQMPPMPQMNPMHCPMQPMCPPQCMKQPNMDSKCQHMNNCGKCCGNNQARPHLKDKNMFPPKFGMKPPMNENLISKLKNFGCKKETKSDIMKNTEKIEKSSENSNKEPLKTQDEK